VRPLLSAPLPLAEFGEALDRVRSGHGIKTHVRPRPGLLYGVIPD